MRNFTEEGRPKHIKERDGINHKFASVAYKGFSSRKEIQKQRIVYNDKEKRQKQEAEETWFLQLLLNDTNDNTATVELGISRSITSDSVRSVSDSIPFATLTMIWPSL